MVSLPAVGGVPCARVGRAAEVGAELIVDLAEGGRTRVETDPEAVGQILFNLVILSVW